MLDYCKILKEARQFNISPHKIAKRKLRYRLKGDSPGCFFCENLRFADYKNSGERRYQCCLIGETIDKNSDVDSMHVCDSFKAISRGKRHNYKDYFKLVGEQIKDDERN